MNIGIREVDTKKLSITTRSTTTPAHDHLECSRRLLPRSSATDPPVHGDDEEAYLVDEVYLAVNIHKERIRKRQDGVQ